MFLMSEEEFRKIEQEILRERRIRDDELECAACGFVGKSAEFYNSSVHNKFKICPVCGTVRFVCDENKGYAKVRRQ